MSVIFQIISFMVSFLYGVFFAFLCKIHFFYVNPMKVYWQFILTIIFILDSVLGYVILLYHINEGVIHIYFLILVLLGYYSFPILQKKCKPFKKHLSFLENKNKE